MCKQYKEHIHIIQDNGNTTYSTSCPDCFQKLLKHPELLKENSNK